MREIILLLLFYLIYATDGQQPNIIIILGDDIGWNDMSYHGSNQIPTPNIDALSYNGVILNRFYTQATCTPSRAALLTGNYPIRMGMQGPPMRAGVNSYIPLDMPTLPERLKTLGYTTNLVGKWHLGHACRSYCPTGRGFDQHFGYWNGLVDYFNYTLRQNASRIGYDLHNEFDTTYEEYDQYATDVFTEKSVEIIQNHNQSTPLFLMVAHLAGHTGYDGTTLGVPDTNYTDETYYYIESERRRLYADIINRLDGSVGQIVTALSDADMLENSIIFYSSDNGGQTIGNMANSASNWPLKGTKHTYFEGGIRVAATIYSPLLTNKNYVNNELIHITDLYATLYGLAGGNVSELTDVDSVDQWETISENASSQRDELLVDFDEINNVSAIIAYNGKYKLVYGSLYNGTQDIHLGESGRGDEVPTYDVSEVLNSEVNMAILSLSTDNELTEDIIEELRASVDISCDGTGLEEVTCVAGCLFDLEEDPCEYSNIISDYSDIALELSERLVVYEAELVPQGVKPIEAESDPSNFDGVWSTWLEGVDCPEITL